MSFRSFLTSLKSRPVASARRPDRRPAARLRAEPLEDRSLPSGTVSLAPSDDSPLVGERIIKTLEEIRDGSVTRIRVNTPAEAVERLAVGG